MNSDLVLVQMRRIGRAEPLKLLCTDTGWFNLFGQLVVSLRMGDCTGFLTGVCRTPSAWRTASSQLFSLPANRTQAPHQPATDGNKRAA